MHRAHVAVQQPGPVQLAEDGRDAAGPVHVLHVVLRRVRGDLGQAGHPAGDRVDVGHVEVQLRLAAAASRCSTVFVEPPIATSRATAFSNAARPAIERGSTEASSPS